MRYIAFIKAETLINKPQLFEVLKHYFSNIQDFSGEYFGRKPSIKDLKKFVESRNIKVVGFNCKVKKFKLLKTTSFLARYDIKVIEKSVSQFSVNKKPCRDMYVELCKELLFSENGHNLMYIITIEE